MKRVSIKNFSIFNYIAIRKSLLILVIGNSSRMNASGLPWLRKHMTNRKDVFDSYHHLPSWTDLDLEIFEALLCNKKTIAKHSYNSSTLCLGDTSRMKSYNSPC